MGKGQSRKSKDETVAEEKAESPAKEAAEKRAGKGQGKNWIAGAIKKPGALHKQMGVPQGKKIPSGRLKAAASKGGTLGKRARLAETLKGFGKGQDVTRDDYERDPTSADSLTMSPKIAPKPDTHYLTEQPPVGGGQARKKRLGKGSGSPTGGDYDSDTAQPLDSERSSMNKSYSGTSMRSPNTSELYPAADPKRNRPQMLGSGQSRKKRGVGKGQGPVQPPGGSMPPRGISGSMPLPGLRPKAHHPHRPAGMQPPGGMKPMGAMGPPPGGLGMPPGGPGMPPGGPGLPPMGGGGPSGPPILPGAGVGGTPGMPPPRPMMGGGQARKPAAKKPAAKKTAAKKK